MPGSLKLFSHTSNSLAWFPPLILTTLLFSMVKQTGSSILPHGGTIEPSKTRVPLMDSKSGVLAISALY